MGPGRPPNEKDLITNINGSPRVWLGALVSTGTAVNNATTATPFYTTPLSSTGSPATGPANFTNTLAGKTLLLQTTAAGLIFPSFSPNMPPNAVPNQFIIALQSVLPPLPGTCPGVALTSGERVVIIMSPVDGWLQWLPLTGSANCLVWELV